MPNTIIRDVANYCWSNKFLDVFQNFFRDYAIDFVDAPETLQEGEHDLNYHALFTKYLDVYENTLTDYLKTLDTSIEDFYKAVREYEEEDGSDQYIGHFIKCLLASMSYESFYRVMAKEGKRKKIELELEAQKKEWEANEEDDDDAVYDDVADVKGVSLASSDGNDNRATFKSDGKGTDDIAEDYNDSAGYKGEGKSSYK